MMRRIWALLITLAAAEGVSPMTGLPLSGGLFGVKASALVW